VNSPNGTPSNGSATSQSRSHAATGVVAVVPVRSLRDGKTRLAAALPQAAREALTRRMLRGVVEAALASDAVDAVLVVSPDPAARALAAELGDGVVPLAQDPAVPGLNPALDLGRSWARARMASALLVLFGDLPLLGADDVRAIVARDAPVVLAPDRHGTGTNALLLRAPGSPGSGRAPIPSAGRPRAVTHGGSGTAAATRSAGDRSVPSDFRFAFGAESYARHAAEAARLGLAVATVLTTGTALDLDTPADWRALSGGEARAIGGELPLREIWDGATPGTLGVDA
jgi:2-phospho-L-lactate guanylyltransferase